MGAGAPVSAAPIGYLPAVPADPVSIITFPLRLGFGIARRTLGPVIGLAERVLGGNGDGPQHEPERREEPRAAAEPDQDAGRPVAKAPPAVPAADLAPPPDVEPLPAPSAVEAAGSGPVPPSEVDEPVHVSEEAVLVAESADLGAEDGAGANIHVDEPWDGYRRQSAADVIAALEAAGAAQAAAVQLYEGTHRGRKTVLEAASRRLKTVSR